MEKMNNVNVHIKDRRAPSEVLDPFMIPAVQEHDEGCKGAGGPDPVVHDQDAERALESCNGNSELRSCMR